MIRTMKNVNLFNKRGLRDFEIIEKFEAGVELRGFEVKSLYAGHGSIDSAYITIHDGQAFVINFSIPPYQPKNTPAGYDPLRSRRLLLKKEEILYLAGRISSGGNLTIAPIKLYNKNRKIKLEIGLAKGLKKYEKREKIKKKEMRRELKKYNL